MEKLAAPMLCVALAILASACSAAPQSVDEVVAFTSRDGQLVSAMYLADRRGNYVASDGVARLSLSCHECANMAQDEVLAQWDEAVEANRFDVRYVPVSGMTGLSRRNVVYKFASVDLDALDGVDRLQVGDTPQLCVDFAASGGQTIRGCERISWRPVRAS